MLGSLVAVWLLNKRIPKIDEFHPICFKFIVVEERGKCKSDGDFIDSKLNVCSLQRARARFQSFESEVVESGDRGLEHSRVCIHPITNI